MNRLLTDSEIDSTAPVDLAREAAFALGHLGVTPAALTVATGDWSRRLEPRVMQVLVVLAQASPDVAGRGALNARVWGGRVVGDDAINRAVQTLRRLAADAPPPVPFAIETVPRVGYRLMLGKTPAVEPRADLDAISDAPSSPADAEPRRVATADARDEAAPSRSRDRLAARIVVVAIALVAVLAAVIVWRIVEARAAAPVAWTIAGSATLDDIPPGARDVVLSPDGRRLAYRGQDGGHDRIFIRATGDVGVGSAVSPAGIDARRPAWSPDNATLAFAGYEVGRPCRLYVLRPGRPASLVGVCETVRDPRFAWSADGRALLLGDAPGENAVPRIGAVRIADGQRMVLSSPPGDSNGDGLPVPRGNDIVFQRQYGWYDDGWIVRDMATGRERQVWRRSGIFGSAIAPLPDGSMAIAWTRAGVSGLDLVDSNGKVRAQPVALGPVSALSVAGTRLLVETDHIETELIRPGDTGAPGAVLATVRGRISDAILLPDGRLRFPVASAGVGRIWERDAVGSVRPWGAFSAARIQALVSSPDRRLTAAIITGDAGREIIVFDPLGHPVYRWNPHIRSINAAAWSGDGRTLIIPLLDGAGWRLFAVDPFGKAPPRDLGLPGFAVVESVGPALYAVRAGETTGIRELWRLDGRVRRLPIDLTLFDIVNWRATEQGIWLPDRSDRDHPRLVLRDGDTGRVVRSVAAPGITGPSTGLASDVRGPVYVRMTRDAPEYSLLTLSRRAR